MRAPDESRGSTLAAYNGTANVLELPLISESLSVLAIDGALGTWVVSLCLMALWLKSVIKTIYMILLYHEAPHHYPPQNIPLIALAGSVMANGCLVRLGRLFVELNLPSKANSDIARRWRKECLNDHPMCYQTSTRRRLPSRRHSMLELPIFQRSLA